MSFMICDQCGVNNTDNANYCRGCGRKLDQFSIKVFVRMPTCGKDSYQDQARVLLKNSLGNKKEAITKTYADQPNVYALFAHINKGNYFLSCETDDDGYSYDYKWIDLPISVSNDKIEIELNCSNATCVPAEVKENKPEMASEDNSKDHQQHTAPADQSVSTDNTLNDAVEQMPAGLWLRFLSFFIDWYIIQMVLLLSLALLDNLSIGIILALAYKPVFESFWLQATPGKLIFEIYVCDQNGKPLSIFRSIIRNLLIPISIIPLGAGYVIAVFNQKKQSFGDIVTKAGVNKRQELGGIDIIGRLIAIVFVIVLIFDPIYRKLEEGVEWMGVATTQMTYLSTAYVQTIAWVVTPAYAVYLAIRFASKALKRRLSVDLKLIIGIIVLLLVLVGVVVVIAEKTNDYKMEVSSLPSDVLAVANKNLRKSKAEKALYLYKRVLEIEPDNTDAYAGIARAYFQKNDYQQSVNWYSKAIRKEPKNPDLYSLRAWAYRSLKMQDKALADFNTAIALDKTEPKHYGYIALIYREMNNADKEVEYLSKEIETMKQFGKEDSFTYSLRSDALERKGMYAEAINDMTRAIELSPYEDLYLYKRFILNLRADRYPDARRDFVETKKKGPFYLKGYEIYFDHAAIPEKKLYAIISPSNPEWKNMFTQPGASEILIGEKGWILTKSSLLEFHSDLNKARLTNKQKEDIVRLIREARKPR